MSTTFLIQIRGTGLAKAAAVTVFEDVVDAIVAAQDEGAPEPTGTLTHDEKTAETAAEHLAP